MSFRERGDCMGGFLKHRGTEAQREGGRKRGRWKGRGGEREGGRERRRQGDR